MRKIEAFEAKDGRMYRTREGAIEADFIWDIRDAWGSLPSAPGKPDPEAFAKLLISYSQARFMLIDTLARYERRLEDHTYDQTDT